MLPTVPSIPRCLTLASNSSANLKKNRSRYASAPYHNNSTAMTLLVNDRKDVQAICKGFLERPLGTRPNV